MRCPQRVYCYCNQSRFRSGRGEVYLGCRLRPVHFSCPMARSNRGRPSPPSSSRSCSRSYSGSSSGSSSRSRSRSRSLSSSSSSHSRSGSSRSPSPPGPRKRSVPPLIYFLDLVLSLRIDLCSAEIIKEMQGEEIMRYRFLVSIFLLVIANFRKLMKKVFAFLMSFLTPCFSVPAPQKLRSEVGLHRRLKGLLHP